MFWSENELDYLISNYSVIPPIKIAWFLNRSYSAIIQNGTTYDIQYSDYRAVEFLNYIYRDSNIDICMDRKYSKYLKALEWQNKKIACN